MTEKATGTIDQAQDFAVLAPSNGGAKKSVVWLGVSEDRKVNRRLSREV